MDGQVRVHAIEHLMATRHSCRGFLADELPQPLIERILETAQRLVALGFDVIATDGTAKHLAEQGVTVTQVNKVAQGRPHIVDRIKNGDIALIVNTTEGVQSMKDSQSIRVAALYGKIPYFTTAAASVAAARAIAALRERTLEVRSLQSYYSAAR